MKLSKPICVLLVVLLPTLMACEQETRHDPINVTQHVMGLRTTLDNGMVPDDQKVVLYGVTLEVPDKKVLSNCSREDLADFVRLLFKNVEETIPENHAAFKLWIYVTLYPHKKFSVRMRHGDEVSKFLIQKIRDKVLGGKGLITKRSSVRFVVNIMVR